MPDRKKVIKALETETMNFTPACTSDECLKETMKMALELLKWQEPVRPGIGGNQASCWWYICPECELSVDKGDKYCRYCGRRFVWDGDEH